jgi:hypothetical protein
MGVRVEKEDGRRAKRERTLVIVCKGQEAWRFLLISSRLCHGFSARCTGLHHYCVALRACDLWAPGLSWFRHLDWGPSNPGATTHAGRKFIAQPQGSTPIRPCRGSEA